MLALVGVLATVGVALGLRPTTAPVAGGTPRLAVDREAIDLGDVRFERAVRATFTLTNAGDGVLLIGREPAVRVVEGC
ncbi:MAG: hypothetical protein HY614_02795 [Candidatus Rokubacteria bacterium]|nr:hypothetical protein [Candidatus Rokubacteria bacterium]